MQVPEANGVRVLISKYIVFLDVAIIHFGTLYYYYYSHCMDTNAY